VRAGTFESSRRIQRPQPAREPDEAEGRSPASGRCGLAGGPSRAAGRERSQSPGGDAGKDRSGPVSRVLSRAAISLGRRLPAVSSNLPGSSNGPDRLVPEIALRLLPAWSCSQWGLPCQCSHLHRGALLPHLFTLTAPACARVTPFARRRGGLFSVALSRSLRTVGVTHHCVLWSPDFPPRRSPRELPPPTPGSGRSVRSGHLLFYGAFEAGVQTPTVSSMQPEA